MSTQFKGFILFKGYKVHFKRDLFGVSEISKLRIDKEDIIEFIKNADASTKIKITKGSIQVYDEMLYKRSLVYSIALDGIRKRNPLRILRLSEAINKLDDYSLHFWYTEAVSIFKQKGLRGIKRVSRSLRVLYGVDK
jgi:hypothetical protein